MVAKCFILLNNLLIKNETIPAIQICVLSLLMNEFVLHLMFMDGLVSTTKNKKAPLGNLM